MVEQTVAKENLDKEFVDIFTTLMLLADNLNIDILASLNKKVLLKGKTYLETQD